MLVRTKNENDSCNRTLWVEIDTATLYGTAGTNGMKCQFRVTCCSDENEDLLPTASIGDRLSLDLEKCFVSIMTIQKDEIRIVLDIPVNGEWCLFEIYGRTCDYNDYDIDTDRWEQL